MKCVAKSCFGGRNTRGNDVGELIGARDFPKHINIFIGHAATVEGINR
jgi:hypothetical protein